MRLLDLVVGAMALAAGALLVVVASLLCLDVAVRYLQIVNIAWIGDIASVSLYLVTFLAAPWVLHEHGHIAVDSALRAMPQRLRAAVERTAMLLGAAICAVLTVYAVRVLIASHSAGTQVYKMLVYPEWWLFVVPPVTFATMALIFAKGAFAPSSTVGAAR